MEELDFLAQEDCAALRTDTVATLQITAPPVVNQNMEHATLTLPEALPMSSVDQAMEARFAVTINAAVWEATVEPHQIIVRTLITVPLALEDVIQTLRQQDLRLKTLQDHCLAQLPMTMMCMTASLTKL
jgi:hypothetical protein